MWDGVNMSYRYLSPLRPLGCWVSLDQEFTLEEPLPSDIDPFDPEWHIHNVLVTESPLPKEKIKSLQLIDLELVNNQKILCDKLDKMEIRTKTAYVETMVKEELKSKIIAGKIKNETVLEKMVSKYEQYAM